MRFTVGTSRRDKWQNQTPTHFVQKTPLHLCAEAGLAQMTGVWFFLPHRRRDKHQAYGCLTLVFARGIPQKPFQAGDVQFQPSDGGRKQPDFFFQKL